MDPARQRILLHERPDMLDVRIERDETRVSGAERLQRIVRRSNGQRACRNERDDHTRHDSLITWSGYGIGIHVRESSQAGISVPQTAVYMNGLMMDYPLTLQHFLERAGRLFPDKEIVTRTAVGTHRYRYRDYYGRTHRLAHVLRQMGVERGERAGTLCWNTHQHLELYFAIACYGAVLHTLNLRLSPDDLAYIVTHAEDRVIFVDTSLLPTLEKIRDRITCVRRVVVIGGESDQYEALLAAAPEQLYVWPRLDETCAAGMCYTSGTTGNPKGVVYSHRSLFLHSMSFAMADTFG